MVNLDAYSPCEELLPLTIGAVVLIEIVLPENQVWSVSPSPVGAGETKSDTKSKTLWIGRNHSLQIGGSAPVSGAVTEQSDAWACISVQGEDAGKVLARLCPVDLGKLNEGEVACTLLNHLNAIIVATSDGFEIYAFRSFARTLVHDLQEAAEMVKARKGLGL